MVEGNKEGEKDEKMGVCSVVSSESLLFLSSSSSSVSLANEEKKSPSRKGRKKTAREMAQTAARSNAARLGVSKRLAGRTEMSYLSKLITNTLTAVATLVNVTQASWKQQSVAKLLSPFSFAGTRITATVSGKQSTQTSMSSTWRLTVTRLLTESTRLDWAQ